MLLELFRRIKILIEVECGSDNFLICAYRIQINRGTNWMVLRQWFLIGLTIDFQFWCLNIFLVYKNRNGISSKLGFTIIHFTFFCLFDIEYIFYCFSEIKHEKCCKCVFKLPSLSTPKNSIEWWNFYRFRLQK